jgi:ribosomal protein S18 acetylase RimI-like enzyme
LAVDILTAAFHDYAAMRFFFEPDRSDYDRKLRQMVDFFSEARLQMDLPPIIVLENGQPVAAALANPPSSSVFTTDLRQRLEDLKQNVGTAVMDNLMAYENTCEAMEPEAPHYYLGMLGVLPGQQGKGYARLIIDHLQEMVDNHPQATGICLNTEKPNNVPFYRHLGFEVIGEEDVGPLHTWSLFRPSS